MDAILALLIALGVFIPCAMFGWSAFASKAKQEPEPAAEQVEQEPEPQEPVDVEISVARVANTRVTNNIAVNVIQQAAQVLGIAPAPRAPLPPGGSVPGGPQSSGGSGGAARAPWADDLEDMLRNVDDVEAAEGMRRPSWADAEVIRTERPATPLPPIAIEQGTQPAATRVVQEERSETPRTTQPAVSVRESRPPVLALTGTQVDVEQPLVTLEGVDMSDAPIVRASDGSAARVPSVGQLKSALASGGFERLLSWLRAFKKASNNTRTQAENLHADAMAIARRARTKYALAMQAFQAVQMDGLDRQTITRMFDMLQQAEREAVAAAAATRSTANLVVAAGGAQPAIAAAINTLTRNHGAIAGAVKASPQPVRDVTWYKN